MSLLRRFLDWVRGRVFSPTFLKFNIVGGIGIVVNVAAFTALTEILNVYHMIAGALATELAILNNFTLNHIWTFRERKGEMPLAVRLLLFHLSRLLGMAVTLITLYLLADVFLLHELLSYLVAIALGVVANFYTSDVYVWADR